MVENRLWKDAILPSWQTVVIGHNLITINNYATRVVASLGTQCAAMFVAVELSCDHPLLMHVQS